jgi:hypothetical protein
MPNRTHLVVPDAHVDPDVDNERFTWLGRLIVDRQPDVIIQMGDFSDMKSLSSYDKGRKDFEGRRYERDISSANDALKRIDDELKRHNENARKSKKSQYKPRMVSLGGNHEEGRIARLVQLHPEFDGVFSVHQIKFLEYGWEYIPYEVPIEIDGIWYCHHFPTGVSGEPISGANIGQSLIAKNMVSSTVGHSHVFDLAMRATPSGKRIWGMSSGCYFEHKMPFARATQDRFWWAGVVFCKNVEDGDYSPECLSMKEIKENYNNA